MELAPLEDRCRQCIALMDQGMTAIEQEDVAAIEAIAQASTLLVEGLGQAWDAVQRHVAQGGLTGQEAEVERLRCLMQEALTRSDRNQALMVSWMEQIRHSLGAVAQGSTAMAGYAQAAQRADSVLHAEL